MTTDPGPSHAPVALICSDLDGTLLGNPEYLRRFRAAWEGLDAAARPLLMFNSGRSVADVRSLIGSGILPAPDVIVGGVGTELFDPTDRRAAADFQAKFGGGWDRSKIDEIVGQTPGVTRQKRDGLHPFQSSWYWTQAKNTQIAALRARLGEAGLRANVIYSCEKYLDVLPANADKGQALSWYCERHGIPLQHVIVAGDTGNDTSMFLLEGVRRILPENALPELHLELLGRPKFMSPRIFAEGVMDGLCHYRVLAAMPGFAEAMQRQSSEALAAEVGGILL